MAGAFPPASTLGGPAAPVAAVSGYLGDSAILSTARVPRKGRRHPRGTGGGASEWALALRLQRHYSSAPAAARMVPVGAGAPSAVAVALDYRSDVLLVWAQGGAIYAREITQGGAVQPPRRLAADAGAPELRAVFSDDDRAIVVWRTQGLASGGRAVTSVEASISGEGLGFARPAVVERFVDLRGLVPPAGSLRLTRLSSEAVMMAWTGMRDGRYVVRASPVSLRRGVWAPVTISPPARGGEETLLADLVPGPDAEVLALWTAARRGRGGELDPRRRAIIAAWGHYGGHGEARFASPEAVAPAGLNGTPAKAAMETPSAIRRWRRGPAGGANKRNRVPRLRRRSHPRRGRPARRPAVLHAPASASVPAPASASVPALASALPDTDGPGAASTPPPGGAMVPLPCDYASIESRAMRIGTPLEAWRK